MWEGGAGNVALGYSFKWLRLSFLHRRNPHGIALCLTNLKIFLNHCPCIFIYQSVLVLSQWCCVLFFRCRRRCFQWPFSLGSSDERINASIYLHVGSPSASTPAKAKREAHNQAPNGFSFTMVLPESFDLILLSSLLVTLDSPFLELLYVLGYEGLNNPKKNKKK